MMNKFYFALLFIWCSCHAHSQEVLRSSTGAWEVDIARNGAIKTLKVDFGGDSLVSVPWHSSGEYAGPSFSGVSLRKAGKYTYRSRDVYPVAHTLSYSEVDGMLTVQVTLKNNSGTVHEAGAESSLQLGINSVMANPKEYFSVFFPTMLRCEPTHFWGYFEAPDGHVLAVASPDAVASWHLDYIGNGHRIGTAGIDLLHSLPLPPRHPQTLVSLMPYEEKTWRFFLLPATSVDGVRPAVARAASAPVLGMERTTASPGETVDISVVAPKGSSPELTVEGPDGSVVALKAVGTDGQTFRYEFTAPHQAGQCNIVATAGGRRSEGSLYVRRPWSWYLRQAGREALRMEQKAAAHREAWMGFFSAYWSLVYYPDSSMLSETESRFNSFLNLMVDPKTGFWYKGKQTWHSRPQNTSWMVAVLTARYAATRKPEHLELAARWADFLIDKFQLPSGAYKGYTALTLGAKFLQELMWYEAPLAAVDTVWKARYERHKRSVEAASRNILEVKDMGDTEGEATYEDSQAGSAWSLLAMHAITTDDEGFSRSCLEAALEVQGRHECLTQALVPDSRMRGGTLRWWEAQYDVLIRRNMMNSPHAWTMRSQFGSLYLYLLTGDERFLNIAFNAMASCSQAVDLSTGELRWAFVPDPYVEVERFVQDYRKSGEGRYVSDVIGEQWIPMISNWWRTPEGSVVYNNERGWSCDNDVHEHFRYIAEMFVQNAFVVERADGSLRTWNCTAKLDGGTIVVTPAEGLVSRVHFNLKGRHGVRVDFASGACIATLGKGMEWVGKGLADYSVPCVYLWNEMIGKH